MPVDTRRRDRPGLDRPARVLITGAGGPAAVSFIEAVNTGATAAGLVGGVEFVAVDIDPNAAGLYLVDREHRALVPRGDSPDFVDAVLAMCIERSIDVLVPTVDSEMLPVIRRAAEFEAAGTTVLSAAEATLERCLDKWTLIQSCQGVVALPATALLDEGFAPASFTWPAIVKPRQGSGSRGVELIDGPTGLDHLRRDGQFDGSMIVQELLPGIEHSIDVLAYRDGRIAAAVPRTRLKVDSGIAVAGCTEPDPALEDYARRIAAAIGLTSVANVQVKQDRAGEPRLLEINPRFPGSMPLTVAAGVDMPSLALADALAIPVPDTVPFRALAMVRTWKETFMDVSDFAVDALRPIAASVAEVAP